VRNSAAVLVLTVIVLLCLQVHLQGQETWRRTDPDSAVYLPRGQDDRCNQQVNAVLTPKGTLVVVWTMASVEGRLDQRVVVSRSGDRGRTWSQPKVLDGQENGNGRLATYGFPFLTPRTGRIYVFYAKNTGQNSVRADAAGRVWPVTAVHDGPRRAAAGRDHQRTNRFLFEPAGGSRQALPVLQRLEVLRPLQGRDGCHRETSTKRFFGGLAISVGCYAGWHALRNEGRGTSGKHAPKTPQTRRIANPSWIV